MKLKAKRDAVTNPPSEFALRVPDIDKRNDNLLKQGHSVVVPSNTLQTYSMTDGDYIKKHTVNHMEHKVSNFTPKFLALMKKSSPASEYPADDEPPVEGGVEGVEGASVSDGGKEEEEAGDEGKTQATSASKGGRKADAESGDYELFDKPPPLTSVGNKEVYEPVAQAYQKMKLPIVLVPERQGASMVINNKTLAELTEADLPKLKALVIKMGTLRDRLQGSFHKRVKSDVKKIEAVIKRLEPSFKGERVKSKSAMGLPESLAVAKELGLVAKGAGGGGGGVGGGGAVADEGEWEYPKKKGKGKK
jgi:hypothetical protein